MKSSKYRKIIKNTKIVSSQNRGSQLFRIGVEKIDSFELVEGMNSLILKPLESIKDSGEYIRLKENLMLQGVVFVHSGPTADYFYFKIKIICNKDSTEDIKINNIDESNGVKYLVQAIKDVTANNYEYPLSGFDIFIENIDYTRSVYSQNEFVDQINKLVHFGFTDLFNHDCLITDLRL